MSSDSYRLHVLLNPEDPHDRVVIEALERLGDRGKSRWVRQMLYESVTGPARDEILAEIRAVRQAVERLETEGVAVQSAREPGYIEEPEEAARNLDGLLDRLETW